MALVPLPWLSYAGLLKLLLSLRKRQLQPKFSGSFNCRFAFRTKVDNHAS